MTGKTNNEERWRMVSLFFCYFNKKINDFIIYIINAIDFFLACVNVREGTIQTNIFGTGGDHHPNLAAHARVGGMLLLTPAG